MRINLKRGLPGSNRRGNGVQCLRLEEGLRERIEYYMRETGIDGIDEAVGSLVEKGYKYWLMENSYKDKIGERVNWDPVYWSMKLASAYAYYKLRLRDAVEEMKKLTMALGGVLGELRLCYEKPETVKGDTAYKEKIELYRRQLEAYVEKFITSLRVDLDGPDNYVEDEEEFLRELEELVKKYRAMVARKHR